MLRDELAEQPTVLVIEDLHWGDEATFDVLRLLCRRMDVPSLVDRAPIATTASTAITRCACSSATSRRRRPSSGSRSEPLSAAAVGQLAVGYEVDPADLYARTGGNPFFVAAGARGR